MYNIIINLIASVYITEKQDRYFISTNEKHYNPISYALNSNDLLISLNDILDKLISEYISIMPEFKLKYTLLSVKKEDQYIYINYCTMVPIDTKLKSNVCYSLSRNISVINPLARKAMAYV